MCGVVLLLRLLWVIMCVLGVIVVFCRLMLFYDSMCVLFGLIFSRLKLCIGSGVMGEWLIIELRVSDFCDMVCVLGRLFIFV